MREVGMMNRRGFLAMLGTGIAAAAVPAIRAFPADDFAISFDALPKPPPVGTNFATLSQAETLVWSMWKAARNQSFISPCPEVGDHRETFPL